MKLGELVRDKTEIVERCYGKAEAIYDELKYISSVKIGKIPGRVGVCFLQDQAGADVAVLVIKGTKKLLPV